MNVPSAPGSSCSRYRRRVMDVGKDGALMPVCMCCWRACLVRHDGRGSGLTNEQIQTGTPDAYAARFPQHALTLFRLRDSSKQLKGAERKKTPFCEHI